MAYSTVEYAICTYIVIRKQFVRKKNYFCNILSVYYRQKEDDNMKKLITVLLSILILVGCTSTPTATMTEEEMEARIDQKIAEKWDAFMKEKDEEKKDEVNKESKEEEGTQIADVLYYIHKLKDKDFTSTYGGENEKVWYTAAEELGNIGKESIPFLIKNLETKNDYERALTLYALLLASQSDDVKVFTKGEYIEVNLDFDASTHKEYVDIAKAWWDKYKSNWE